MAKYPDFGPLRDLFQHHIDSYNHLIESGLETTLSGIKPIEVHDTFTNKKLRNILLCRQAKISYSGAFVADVCFQYNDGPVIRERFHLGQFPVMLKSKICHLKNASSGMLVSYREEPAEMGGADPMSMVRNSFRARREGYSDKAVVIRCVREDQSAVTVKLYYLNNGSARVGFWIGGREFLLPVGVVLKEEV
ncbi:hypothetical protein Cgig2_022982 [Carnegiea gigantea]|uniref:DNA-directed RNA polymerase n=1 Tax=Carnegiea gigantea TaxID=171969 RepID=A0A9Q1Q7H8_9CARY|nr:hypothetical protein Cgig2_022982 [Carnegiea gigantea]